MGRTQTAASAHESQHPTYLAGSMVARFRFNELVASGRRYCSYVPPVPDGDGYFRTVLVVENEAGYFDMGTFDKNLGRAECEASASNQCRGLTEDDATHIVCSSIKAQIARRS